MRNHGTMADAMGKAGQEGFVHRIAQLFHLGLAVSDAMRHLLRGEERMVRIQHEGREWELETRATPYLSIRITPMH